MSDNLATCTGVRKRCSWRSIFGSSVSAHGLRATSRALTADAMTLLTIWCALMTVAGALPSAMRWATHACTASWSIDESHFLPNVGRIRDRA